MVKIRLTRGGATKRPHYRIIAIDERKARDSRPLEYLGTYDPNTPERVADIRTEAVDTWMAKGAQMSETVTSLVKKSRKAASAATA